MRDRLPPLESLRAFELSARLKAFTHAAARLGLSQSAVTRQVAALEASLGVKLFERGRRGVTLTPEGDAYFQEIAPAFEVLNAATQRLRQRGARETLRLRVYPVFAVKWLVPRLANLQAFAPGIQIDLDTGVEPVDFHRHALDAAIQLGAPARAEVRAEDLFPDEIEPVCSPDLLRKLGRPMELDDLAELPLLHARYRRADWRDWMAAQGRPDLLIPAGLEFPSSVLTYQAAQEGLGVAIGQTRLLQHDFSRGALAKPFSRPFVRSQSYQFLTPSDREQPQRVRRVRAWLMDAVADGVLERQQMERLRR